MQVAPGPADNSLWMANTWQQALDKQQFLHNKNFSGSEKSYPGPGQETLYAEVGEPSSFRGNFSSFGGTGGSYRSEPAPYATTTLAMNKMRTLVSVGEEIPNGMTCTSEPCNLAIRTLAFVYIFQVHLVK